MRIVCPSCKAAYEVPDALLGSPERRLRCARCANEWVPELPVATLPAVVEPAPLALPPPEERPAEPRPLREPRPPPIPRVDGEPPPFIRERAGQGSMLGSLAVVVVSLALLGGLAWAAYAWRDGIMLAWPASQRLFGALGLR